MDRAVKLHKKVDLTVYMATCSWHRCFIFAFVLYFPSFREIPPQTNNLYAMQLERLTHILINQISTLNKHCFMMIMIMCKIAQGKFQCHKIRLVEIWIQLATGILSDELYVVSFFTGPPASLFPFSLSCKVLLFNTCFTLFFGGGNPDWSLHPLGVG